VTRFYQFALAALLALGPRFAIADSGPAAAAQIAERLRERIESGRAENGITACGDLVYCRDAVPSFYERRAFRPAWVSANGPLPYTNQLTRCISEAHLEGLRPNDYHSRAISGLLKTLQWENASGSWKMERDVEGAVEMLVDLELLLTDAFLTYGTHLLSGRVDPQTIDPDWHARRRRTQLTPVLEQAIESGWIEEALKGLVPSQPGYGKLKSALTLYREIAEEGAWPEVAGEEKLELGYRGAAVPALRARLVASGDLKSASGVPWEEAAFMRGAAPMDSTWDLDLFDETVAKAVYKFQRRHGLAVDGVVGPKTRAALNKTLDHRIEQLQINMERYRWLPQDLGDRHILVNIPGFELEVYESGEIVMDMRVVVGKRLRRTPVFSDIMTYIVLNPYWKVPEKIALEDILPSARQDSTYLAEKGIRVFDSWGANASEIPRELIDWSSLNDGNFRYKFIQDPGEQNSLGRIKFMFPNEFDIYLHDTPARSLFYIPERTFSSGCIRVERPIELAEYLLRDNPKWTREEILAKLEESEERSVNLPEPIPIHLLYWTAYVDEEGSVHFRDDIYERDERLLSALRTLPPGPGATNNARTTEPE
jgi:murein L,D-transpeptidase YcbB/YkuD